MEGESRKWGLKDGEEGADRRIFMAERANSRSSLRGVGGKKGRRGEERALSPTGKKKKKKGRDEEAVDVT